MRAWAVIAKETSFVGGLLLAFTHVTLAAAVIVGAIAMGHELREWRIWYHGTADFVERPTAAPEVTRP
jgi:hypothetical protein